jgi:hypothetical protein
VQRSRSDHSLRHSANQTVQQALGHGLGHGSAASTDVVEAGQVELRKVGLAIRSITMVGMLVQR